MAGEIEQRPHDAARPQRLGLDDMGALLQVRLARVGTQHLGECRDRGERVVELVRDTRDERPELREAVRLQQAPLQQHFARYVHGEEEQLGRLPPWRKIHHHGLDLARRFAADLDGELQVLPLHHRVA